MNPSDINITPAWVNDTIWYQIFPDRFCNGTPKKNKEDINRKEQEKFIYNLKKKLEEKKIKYEIDEDNRSWEFSLSDEININGEVIKLEEHNKILEETSKQSLNLNIDLIIHYPKKIRKFDALKTVGAGWGLLFFVSALSVAL